MARILGVKDEVSFASLAEYKGSWRRFEMKTAELSGILHGKPRKITVISDYGHHPTEVLATLMGAREKFGKAKIWLIFQPHQHQRTFYLLKDFVKLFKQAKIDHIIITDIYDVAGRETQKINKKISAEELVKKIARKNVVYMPEAAAEQFVKQGIAENDVLIIMGAGDIYKLYDTF
ncbi:MAG TPA: cyanophycin synthetase [Negativicutes bacterium]|nr:cyanophycin synthetase [Negativicutes bacterium]